MTKRSLTWSFESSSLFIVRQHFPSPRGFLVVMGLPAEGRSSDVQACGVLCWKIPITAAIAKPMIRFWAVHLSSLGLTAGTRANCSIVHWIACSHEAQSWRGLGTTLFDLIGIQQTPEDLLGSQSKC
jgi:hypothetical protein